MRKYNLNEIIKTIIFVLFAFNLFRILINGDIKMYLHPKMFKFVYLSAFVFLILSFYSFKNILNLNSFNRLNYKALAFLIPILFFMAKPSPLSTSALENMSFNVLQQNIPKDKLEEVNIQKTQEVSTEKLEEKNNNGNEKNIGSNSQESKSIENVQIDKEKTETLGVPIATHNTGSAVDEEGNIIETPSLESIEGTMYDPSEFLNSILDAYSKNEDAIKKEFKIVGYIYREDFFAENQFMVGRMLLTCCVVDANPVGLLVQGSGDMKEQYPDNTWVEVKGMLVTKSIYSPYEKKNIDVVAIDMKSIKKVEPAETPYVYFN